MARRPTLKGKGADIFLGEEAPDAEKEQTRTPSDQYGDKATFYLPPDLLDRLDNLWMNLRSKNRKLRKSHLVRDLLEVGMKGYNKE